MHLITIKAATRRNKNMISSKPTWKEKQSKRAVWQEKNLERSRKRAVRSMLPRQICSLGATIGVKRVSPVKAEAHQGVLLRVQYVLILRHAYKQTFKSK